MEGLGTHRRGMDALTLGSRSEPGRLASLPEGVKAARVLVPGAARAQGSLVPSQAFFTPQRQLVNNLTARHCLYSLALSPTPWPLPVLSEIKGALAIPRSAGGARLDTWRKAFLRLRDLSLRFTMLSVALLLLEQLHSN